MYRVLCDDLPLFDLRSDELVLTNPKIKLADNSAGSFDFVITSKHPYYNNIKKLKSKIQVFQDDVELFCGRVTEEKNDFYNQKYFYCEGELNYLVDSIQRPAEYHNQTVRGFLQTLVNIHNAQVESDKWFTVGAVTVIDSNDSLYRYTNYENTLTCVSEKLVKRLGGHIVIRKVNGIKYLDYLADYPVTCDQVIEFGENLLNYSENTDVGDIATAIIPLGAKLEESTIVALDERLTIKTVNGGSDFIYSQSAVDLYGWVFKTVVFDGVSVPSNLKTKGQAYLNDIQYENMTLEVTAIDLHNLDVDIDRIRMLNLVRVKSSPHGLDRFFPVTEMEIQIDAPESNTLKLGKEKTTSMTSKSSSTNSDIMQKIESIPSESDILKEAAENASALITSATHGHVVTTANEQLIMDTDSTDTCTRLWRWNLNGLGYSKTGYKGTYATAITMDGQILGERLVGGSVSAEKIDITYRSSVEKAIDLAESDANSATDNKLKSYYTSVQVETRITNTSNSILLSAKETATSYTDGKLKNYSTSAQIKVTTDSITSEVSKKLNSSEFTTKLTQSSSYVRIAWNNCSQYIQFEGSSLNIYDYSNYKLMSLDSSGCWYYYNNTTIGKIGTNSWAGDDYFRGLMFQLEDGADYMTWAHQNPGGGNYIVKLIYYANNKKAKQGLHFSCDTYCWGNLRLNENVRTVNWRSGGAGLYSTTHDVGIFGKTATVAGGGTFECTERRFVFWNSPDSIVDCHNKLDMHGWAILNQSDLRFKKNIKPTEVNVLDLFSQIELKEFDWIETNEHESVGIIAQQLQSIIPDLVDENPSDGRLSIKLNKFIPYLVKAIQELNGVIPTNQWKDNMTLLDKKLFIESTKNKQAEEMVEVVNPNIVLPK